MIPYADTTLAELEGPEGVLRSLENARQHPFPLITWYRNLLYTPIGQMSDDDLETLVRQNLWVAHVLPTVLQRLRKEPDADLGLLVRSLERIDPSFWSEHEDFRVEARHLTAQAFLLAQEDRQREEIAQVADAIERVFSGSDED